MPCADEERAWRACARQRAYARAMLRSFSFHYAVLPSYALMLFFSREREARFRFMFICFAVDTLLLFMSLFFFFLAVVDMLFFP